MNTDLIESNEEITNLLDKVEYLEGNVAEATDAQVVENYINESISKIDLFPYYRAFFDSDGVWKNLTDKAKMDHAFMIIRALSAKFPDYMQELNKNHNVHLLDALHRAFSKPSGKPPSFMYISAKKVKEDNRLLKIDKQIIDDYLKINGIERKMFNFVFEEHTDQVLSELKALQKDSENSWKKGTQRKTK